METNELEIKNKIYLYIKIVLKSFFLFYSIITLKIMFIEELTINHPKDVFYHPIFGVYYVFLIFQFYYIFKKKEEKKKDEMITPLSCPKIDLQLIKNDLNILNPQIQKVRNLNR